MVPRCRISKATTYSSLALKENYEYKPLNPRQLLKHVTNNFSQGDLDRNVLALESQNPDRWESFVVRPGFVCDAVPYIGRVWPSSYIFREELGAAMLDAALNGSEQRLLDNATLREKGQAALKSEK